MNTPLTNRKHTRREAFFALLASCGLLAVFSFGLNAQEIPKIKDKVDPDKAERRIDRDRRDSILDSGYTRPGNPDDRRGAEGDMMEAAFKGPNVQKFKVMGGTVYFVVFKNTGMTEGDTFGTGMANIDNKFRTGRSFKDSYSPRYDRSAKYLYLYQLVNDRALDPKIAKVKGEDQKKGDEGIKWPRFDPKAKPLVSEDLASFALKLLVDPRYITSWGHFSGAAFAANVTDVDINGKAVKTVSDDGKTKVDKEIRLAFSYLPAITTKLTNPTFSRRARSYSLNDLETGLGVDQSTLNLQKSKAFDDLKLIKGEVGGDISWIAYIDNLLKDAVETALEPEYVQLMYMTSEERLAAGTTEGADDDITRAIFRVDWDRLKAMKQGERSVVFGFTTDLPPTTAPIRIDTPKAAAISEGMRLANYFADDATGRGTGAAVGPDGIALTAGGADAAAISMAMGTALGQAPTPVPAPATPAAGFAGITGGGSGIGGTTSGGGGGGFSTPGFSGGFSRPGGGIGGGGGFGTGSSDTQPPTQAQAQQGTQSGAQTINFDATLINQQQQQQKQSQHQSQRQNQNNNHHGHGHHGHVVPAPASLLLALFGLPGLYFLRRKKTEAVAA